jgi:hypothetical protein
MEKSPKQQTLENLFAKHGSDKLSHGYAKYYALHIPNRLHSMLELGVMNGASALSWQEFYSKDADIYLADLFENEDWVNERWCKNRGFIPLKGRQEDLEFLTTFPTGLSLAIDDCSHVPEFTIASFKHIFLNCLKSGKCYVIEDLQTNLPEESFYWTGLVKKFEDTLLWMLENFQETGKIVNPYFNEGEAQMFENLIESVHIYERKIAFIHKR